MFFYDSCQLFLGNITESLSIQINVPTVGATEPHCSSVHVLHADAFSMRTGLQSIADTAYLQGSPYHTAFHFDLGSSTSSDQT